MLFAQESVDPVVHRFDPIPLIAILVPAAFLAFVIAIIVLVQRHQRFSREKQHTERLKMIEAGFPYEVPDSTHRRQKYMHNAFWISFWMVFLVPAAAFSAATTSTESLKQTWYLVSVWIGATLCLAKQAALGRSRRSVSDRSTGHGINSIHLLCG